MFSPDSESSEDQRKHQMKFLSCGSSGGCLFFAMFCGYGFLASGEFSGAQEMWWKVGYGTVGGL